MKVAIYMSSRYKNYDKLSEILNKTLGSLGAPIDEIMYNEKNDLIKKYADEHKIKTHAFSEEWDNYDKNAGPICVAQMIKPADKCIALWDGGSKGCRTFIKKCYEYGKQPITKKLNTSIQYPNSKEKKAMKNQEQANMEQQYLGGMTPPSTPADAPTPMSMNEPVVSTPMNMTMPVEPTLDIPQPTEPAPVQPETIEQPVEPPPQPVQAQTPTQPETAPTQPTQEQPPQNEQQ